MYWLYLIFFIIAVFTPDIITKDFPSLSEEKAEELIIFILGATAFAIFMATEKKLNFQLREKSNIQREASMASKDLTNTYTYIGEINRKMDILKEITLSIAEKGKINGEKESELYGSIIHAVQMFTKSKNVGIKFIDIKRSAIIKEIGKNKKAKCDFKSKIMSEENRNYLDLNGMIYVRSIKSANNIVACIAIEKINKNQKLEDPELIRVLASQALEVFNLSQKSA